MRHCPNPECPFHKKFGYAAEYRPGFETCSDCGAALRDGSGEAPAAPPASAPTPHAVPGGDAGSRLGVTVVVVIAVAIAVRVPMLGITWFDRKSGGLLGLLGSERPGSGLFGIGLNPFIGAFQLVEFVALLPFLAARRVGTRAQRRPLTTAAMALGIVFLVAQAWSLTAWANSLQGGEVSAGGLIGQRVAMAQVEPWFFWAALVPSLLLIGAAWLVEQRGLGNGFAVIVAATAASDLLGALIRLWGRVHQELISAGQLLFAVALVAGMTVMLFKLTAWREKPSATAPTWLPVPLSGVVPLSIAGALMSLPATLGSWLPGLASIEQTLRSDANVYNGVFAFLAFDLTLLFGFLFFRPAQVRAQWVARLPAAHADEVQDAARRALPRVLGLSVAVIGAAVALSFFASSRGLVISLGLATVAGLVVFGDLADEWAARRRLGAMEVVAAVHRVTEVEPALAVLRQAGIEAHARSARFRSLLRFFGPYVPVEILVPAMQARDAQAMLERG